MSLGIDFLNVFYGANDATNFTAQLLRLIAKADPSNRMRIASGFPNEVRLYKWWESCPFPPDPKDVRFMAEELKSKEAPDATNP